MLQSDRTTLASNSRAPGFRLALATLGRTLVVLLALQLSGVGHSLADLWLFSDDASAEQHGDCSSDAPGRDCPPGCPRCHHANGGVGALPLKASSVIIGAAPQVVRFTPSEAEDPASPELPSVFRPPKLV